MEEKTHVIRHQVGNVIGIVLCLILLPILIMNVTLIVKSYLNTEEVPNFGGYMPLIVLSDSMYPGIESGDIIVAKTVDPETIEVGDIISFFDPAGNGTSIVSHRVIEVVEENGELGFKTQGDANNVADDATVPADNIVGIYQTRIPGAGNIAMFMQTTTGLIICVMVPLVLLVAYDLLRRRAYEKNKKSDTDALIRELEELRALKEKEVSDEERQAS